MRSKFMPLTLIMLLAALLALSAFSIPVTYSSVAPKVQQGTSLITIDGDFSDWLGIDPVYNDTAENGHDTYPWSSNMTLLSIGNTSEAGLEAYGAPFDEARDLEVLYVVADNETVYFRLDVVSLPHGDSMNWSYGSGNLNASRYVIYFDIDQEEEVGEATEAAATDTGWPIDMRWEMQLAIDGIQPGILEPDPIGGTYLQTSQLGWAKLDHNNVTAGGNITIAQNTTLSAIEVSVPKEDFNKVTGWNNYTLRIMVMSFKPGESWGQYTGAWNRAFDPQAPGTPGEIYTNQPGAPAAGSDYADIIPGGQEAIIPPNITAEERRGVIAAGNWIDIEVAERPEEPPTIADVVQSPVKGEVDPDEEVTVTAIDVEDDRAVKTVLLKWSNDTVIHDVGMSQVTGTNNYTGKIPGQVADTTVKYTVYADDYSGNYYETTEYTYTVKEEVAPPPEIPWMLIAIGVVVVVVVIAAAYMLKRKKPA